MLAIGAPALDGTAAPCSDVYASRTALPAAADEASRAARLFRETTGGAALFLTGREATEAAVKEEAPGCRVVHFATHGFFCRETDEGRGVAGEKLAEDPLLQCGLLLASAAGPSSAMRAAAPPSGEDGILTAGEIVTLDLTSVERVVLSACDSGLGAPAPGEGLLGLRRAFEIAGVRSVLMTLLVIGIGPCFLAKTAHYPVL